MAYEAPRPSRPISSPPVDSADVEESLISVSRSTLAVAISVVVVLVFVSFSAGKMYGSRHPVPPTDEESSGPALVDDDSTDGAADADEALTVQRPATVASREPEHETDASTGAGAAPPREQAAPRPQVALQKGCHYVIVQHLSLGQERTAAEIAQYLKDHGVACATLTGKDIRVVAIEACLISQEDRAASNREKQKADKLLTRVREIGAQMNRDWANMGRKGYTLAGAYLYEFK